MNRQALTYGTKFMLYWSSFIWVMYLAVFFHELAHAITLLSLGGTMYEFVMTWDFGGHILWSVDSVPLESQQQVITLFAVSGGIGAALFFMVLSHKSKGFVIPAFFALLDGYAEAMYLAEIRTNAGAGVMISTWFVCIWLLLRFSFEEK